MLLQCGLCQCLHLPHCTPQSFIFHLDAGQEWGGTVSAGLMEFTKGRSGGNGELPQRPQHHLPPETLASDPP